MAADSKEPTMTQLMERLEQLGEVMRSWADSILSDGDTELAAVAGEASGIAGNGEERLEETPQVA